MIETNGHMPPRRAGHNDVVVTSSVVRWRRRVYGNGRRLISDIASRTRGDRRRRVRTSLLAYVRTTSYVPAERRQMSWQQQTARTIT